MSPHEAVFKCKSAFERALNYHNGIKDAVLKRVAKTALLLMKKKLKSISNGSTFKDLPDLAHQCIQQEQHIAWLKDTVEPNFQSVGTAEALTQIDSPDKKDNKSELSSENIKIDQQPLDPESLAKIIKEKIDQNSVVSDASDLSL